MFMVITGIDLLSIKCNSMRLSDREAKKVTKNCTQNCAEGWWWGWGVLTLNSGGGGGGVCLEYLFFQSRLYPPKFCVSNI